MAKIPRVVWDECRATAERKARTLTYEDLSVLLLELALEKESDQHLNAYRPGGGGSGSHDRGYQGLQLGQGTTQTNARIMSNMLEHFWCDARDEQGCLIHAPDWDQRNCFVVQVEEARHQHRRQSQSARPLQVHSHGFLNSILSVNSEIHFFQICIISPKMSAEKNWAKKS